MSDADPRSARGRHPSGAAFCQKCGASGALVVTTHRNWLFLKERRQVLCEPCFYVVYAWAERWQVNLTVEPL